MSPTWVGGWLQPRAVQTRTVLIEAAASVVTVHGAAGSMNTIIAAAGCTKGAAYFHFDSKGELIAGISDDAMYRCRFVTDHTGTSRTASTRSATDTDRAEAVRALVIEYVRIAAADPVVRADAVLWSDPVHAEHARAGVYAVLRTALACLLDAPDSAESSSTAVDLVMTVLTGLGARPGTGVGFDDPDTVEMVDRMLTVLLPGLRATVGAA